MDLLLTRFSTGKKSTLGVLYRMGEIRGMRQFRCFTLEDQPNEPKIPGETRIPAGRYKIQLRTVGGMTKRYAKKFDFHCGMLWLRDVKGFKWVYIHYGNFERDTDGCLLVGDGAQSNVLDDGMVMSSVTAYTRLYKEVIEAMDLDEKVWITVRDLG